MIKKISQLICVSLFMLGNAYALTCAQLSPTRVAEQFDTIFVALVSNGHFVEAENGENCGWIEGSFEVVENLKGNSDLITIVRKRLVNCNGGGIAGASDSFPIGKYILVATNSDIANIGQCTHTWSDYETNCIIDNVRRQLNIDAPNAEVREWCIEDENSKGELSRINYLRMYLTRLERESESISSEIKELTDQLSEAELGVSPK